MAAERRIAVRAVPARRRREAQLAEASAETAGTPPASGPSAWAPYRQLTAKKPVDELSFPGEGEGALKRVLGPWSLTLLGLGGIIGTGIFVLTGVAARDYAGNMIWLSFVIAGVVAALAALAYAELASMIPVSGSAYTYAYAGLGELVAWIIGWDLILEYAVGAMTVAQGWAGYLAGLLGQSGITIPPEWRYGPLEGGYINILAVGIVLVVTSILVYGIKESANVTSALVAVKAGIIVFVILLGFTLVTGVSGSGDSGFYFTAHETRGFSGVLTAAGLVFFAYIGFDALSTTAEETRNPRRDLPIGILASLGISTVLYILASIVIVRMAPYDTLDRTEPFGAAFEAAGLDWAAAIIRISAVAGITSVLIVLLLSQPRIFFSMARDGLLPRFIADVHPRYKTPWIATLITGTVVAIVGGLLPIRIVAEVTNIGTLFAFGLVSASVVVLRYTAKDAPRGYRVPGPAWLLPGLGALGSLLLILSLPSLTHLIFVFWFGVGLVIYAAYGFRRSRLARGMRERATKASPDDVPAEPAY